jgi:hypothetical protein
MRSLLKKNGLSKNKTHAMTFCFRAQAATKALINHFKILTYEIAALINHFKILTYDEL